MKKIILLLVLLSFTKIEAAVPIKNLVLQGDANGSSNSITNVFLNIKAGNTNGIAPITLNSGRLQSAASNGNIEYDGTNLYMTIAGSRSAFSFGGGTSVNATNLVGILQSTNMMVTGATAGTYTNAAFTIDQYGRFTAIIPNAETTTNLIGIIQDGNLKPTAVTPGAYINTSLTVDQYGRITAASTGSGASQTVKPCEGRLTLVPGNPVPITNVIGATTLYYTPYIGDQISLFDGVSTWSSSTFTEWGVAVPTATNANYDVFVYINGGTNAMALTAWSNDTTRATSLVRQNGVLVKNGATVQRFVGCIRVMTNACDMAVVGGNIPVPGAFNMCVWNTYNRKPATVQISDTNATWTASSSTVGPVDGLASNRLSYIQGLDEDPINAKIGYSSYVSATGRAFVGIGIDSTTVMSGMRVPTQTANTSAIVPGVNSYLGKPGLGFHFVQALQRPSASGTTTFEGSAGSSDQQGCMQIIFDY